MKLLRKLKSFRPFRRLFNFFFRSFEETVYCPSLLEGLAPKYTTLSLWAKLTGRSFSALRRLILRKGVKSIGLSAPVKGDARTIAKLYRIGDLNLYAPVPPKVTNSQILAVVRCAQGEENE